MTRFAALWLVVGLGSAACSSTTPSRSSPGPRCVVDGGKTEPCLGCAVADAQWVDSGALDCPRSVADYCDQNAKPVPSTTAPSCPPATWNALLQSEKQHGWPPTFYECEGFNLAAPEWSCGVGTNVLFVYDGASGQLTNAVEVGGAQHPGKQTCLAGASGIPSVDLVAANCKLFRCFPPDSGIDAGTCDLDAGL